MPLTRGGRKAHSLVRQAATSCAVLMLLSSCAGGEADRAESLDVQQATATLPDARTLP
jgi:hypothetical protein